MDDEEYEGLGMEEIRQGEHKQRRIMRIHKRRKKCEER